MFYEWVTSGAAFGISAFFAVFTFLLFCAAVIGVLALIGQFFRAGGDDR